MKDGDEISPAIAGIVVAMTAIIALVGTAGILFFYGYLIYAAVHFINKFW